MKLCKRLLRRYLPDPVRRLLPLAHQIKYRPDHRRAPILIVPGARVIYTVIPKSANTTIRRFLWAACGEVLPSDATLERIYKQGGGPLLAPRHFPSAELRRIFRDDDWFCFTFVRNPYSRLVSAYKDKIVKHGGEIGYLLHVKKVDPSATGPIPFVAFIQAICQQADREMDGHWRPQNSFILDDLIRYDHIGRIESFDADMLPVTERLKLPEHLIDRFTREPINQTAAETAGPFAPIFTPDLAEMVYQRYREDFERFGYARDSWR